MGAGSSGESVPGWGAQPRRDDGTQLPGSQPPCRAGPGLTGQRAHLTGLASAPRNLPAEPRSAPPASPPPPGPRQPGAGYSPVRARPRPGGASRAAGRVPPGLAEKVPGGRARGLLALRPGARSRGRRPGPLGGGRRVRNKVRPPRRAGRSLVTRCPRRTPGPRAPGRPPRPPHPPWGARRTRPGRRPRSAPNGSPQSQPRPFPPALPAPPPGAERRLRGARWARAQQRKPEHNRAFPAPTPPPPARGLGREGAGEPGCGPGRRAWSRPCSPGRPGSEPGTGSRRDGGPPEVRAVVGAQ